MWKTLVGWFSGKEEEEIAAVKTYCQMEDLREIISFTGMNRPVEILGEAMKLPGVTDAHIDLVVDRSDSTCKYRLTLVDYGGVLDNAILATHPFDNYAVYPISQEVVDYDEVARLGLEVEAQHIAERFIAIGESETPLIFADMSRIWLDPDILRSIPTGFSELPHKTILFSITGQGKLYRITPTSVLNLNHFNTISLDDCLSGLSGNLVAAAKLAFLERKLRADIRRTRHLEIGTGSAGKVYISESGLVSYTIHEIAVRNSILGDDFYHQALQEPGEVMIPDGEFSPIVKSKTIVLPNGLRIPVEDVLLDLFKGIPWAQRNREITFHINDLPLAE